MASSLALAFSPVVLLMSKALRAFIYEIPCSLEKHDEKLPAECTRLVRKEEGCDLVVGNRAYIAQASLPITIDSSIPNAEFSIDFRHLTCGASCRAAFRISPFLLIAHPKDFFSSSGLKHTTISVNITGEDLHGKHLPGHLYKIGPPIVGQVASFTRVNVTKMGWGVVRKLTVTPMLRIEESMEPAGVQIGPVVGQSDIGLEMFNCPDSG
ncbi:hypothetical protein EV426DRAFT_218125 [Tirmania nivea]|nr:hypothetical protein EV426DRAFT_218125 [Tirmania nivea]